MIPHDQLLEMPTVLFQEEPNNTRKPQFGGSTKDKFFDDFEVVDKEEVSSGWEKEMP